MLFLLPIFSFAQTKIVKATTTKQKPTIVKDKPKPKEKQPPKPKVVAKETVKAKPVIKVKPEVKAKPVVKEKPVVKGKPVAKINAVVKEKPAIKGKPIVKTKPKTAEPKKTLTATMHTVVAKETLYSISKLYSVKVDELKTWNKLTSDDLVEGMELIVGFGGLDTKTVVKEREQVVSAPSEDVVEPKVDLTKQPNSKLPEVKQTGDEIIQDEPAEGKNFNGGFFKSLFKDNGKILEGVAGVFKSTSGWDDGKYYCLHNSAKQGTIIKITNTANGKSVYAKVLDIMPDLKQNEKLIIRMSAAGAYALGEQAATNINVAISY